MLKFMEHPIRAPRTSLRNNRTILYGGVALAILLAVVISVLIAWQLLRELERRTELTTQSLVRSAELTLDGLIGSIDIALLASADEIGRQMAAGQPDTQSVTEYLIRQQARLPWVAYLRASDEQGNIIYGPGISIPHTNNSDRDYFIRHRDDPNLGLVVVKPVFGRINKKWLWAFARRITKPDGSFGGVVFASIFVDRVDELLARLKLGTGDSIALRDPDLGLIARYPPASTIKVAIGDSKISAPYAEALKANPNEGTYISGATSIDSVSRTHSYRRSKTGGFIVNVGISRESVLAEWRKQVTIIAGLAVFYSVAVLVFARIISRSWKRQEQHMASLQMSERALQEASRIASLGHYTYDPRADRWTSSETLDRIFGIGSDYPRDAAHWLALVADDSRDAMGQYLETVFARQLPFDREYRIVRVDTGEERWVHGMGRVRVDARGAPISLTGTIQDITERMRADEAARKNEQNFHNLLEAAPFGTIVVDAAGDVLYMNTTFSRLLGYSASDLPNIAAWWLKAYPDPDYRNMAMAEWQGTLLDQPATATVERTFRVCHRDGHALDIRFVAVPLPDRRILVTLEDVSERKRIERQLKQEHVLQQKIISSIPGAFYLIDQTGRFLNWNRNLEAVVGLTSAEMARAHPLDFFGGEDRQRIAAAIETVYESGVATAEAMLLSKDGRATPYFFNGFRFDMEDGPALIGIGLDITERKRAEAAVEKLAFYDQLTSLPNRRLLQDRLRQGVAASSRSGNLGALLLIDMDDFKTLNDTYGHDMGDLLLQQVAQRLQVSVRVGDTVARLGGDEFVIVLVGLSKNEAKAARQTKAIGEKILAVLGEIYRLKDVHYHSTPSIGATLIKGGYATMEDLLKQADLAMYKSKNAGRNMLHFFEPAMEASIQLRAAMEADLRKAIKEKQFLLHYQPQVADQGRLVGAEALLRWQHPERGMVSPLDFIPLAEETGLILPLGDWVLETACRQLSAWAELPETNQLAVSVNVSAYQFRKADFADRVRACLERSGANPAQLTLELTESAVLENVDAAIERMRSLKSLGISFSLDDFGTGFSSLSYLKRLPLDQVKIDKSFVLDITTDPNDAAIVRAIIAMSDSLGLQVIAEGVESEQQLHFLRENGCWHYQGYLFGKPIPIKQWQVSRNSSGQMSLWS